MTCVRAYVIFLLYLCSRKGDRVNKTTSEYLRFVAKMQLFKLVA